MIPIRDSRLSPVAPVVTYTLIALNIFIYLWDRNWHFAGPSVVFADLAMRPDQVTKAILGQGDPFALTKLFTSMFLHANLTHLIGNMLYLLAFGENVEGLLGGMRFALYYIFWGLMAAMAQVFVAPNSAIPMLGASGAIGGVLGCYFLLLPGRSVTVVIPPFIFNLFQIPAWILLGIWFLWQVFLPQEGVANWAHAGGFMAGMLTVLVMGGPKQVWRMSRLDPRMAQNDELDEEEDDLAPRRHWSQGA